ncbi:hypothetical protein AAF712_007811 [Marasmius tenuissimus]|uniref:F-box protein n=1 Tax=Marasmius tenuissimus TaxID=585030 RepID=A0ABR2ZVW8_9AGAR
MDDINNTSTNDENHLQVPKLNRYKSTVTTPTMCNAFKILILVPSDSSIPAEIWTKVFKSATGSNAAWMFNMASGTMSCLSDDLVSLAATCQAFRSISQSISTSHRIILYYPAAPKSSRILDSPPPDLPPLSKNSLDDMKTQLKKCLRGTSRRNKTLEVSVVFFQENCDEGTEKSLFQWLLNQPEHWSSLTVTAPRASWGWRTVFQFLEYTWGSPHWKELEHLKVSAGVGNEENTEHTTDISTLLSRIGCGPQLRVVDFGMNMDTRFDWSSVLIPSQLQSSSWRQLTRLILKHTSTSAVYLLLSSCPNLEAVYAGLTVSGCTVWFQPTNMLRHLELKELGIVKLHPGTDGHDLFTLFDAISCPKLTVLAITCMPALNVGFQDNALLESVEAFLTRSGSTLTGGCIHTTDCGIMESLWEDRLKQHGLVLPHQL